MREGIKQDLELLAQMPEMEASRREALQRSIDDRIDELIVAEDKARQLRATASSYEGSWRDIVLFLCTVLFSIVWWSVDHDRDSWLPVFITTIAASVVAGGYAVRGLRRGVRRARSPRPSWSAVVSGVGSVARAWQHRPTSLRNTVHRPIKLGCITTVTTDPTPASAEKHPSSAYVFTTCR